MSSRSLPAGPVVHSTAPEEATEGLWAPVLYRIVTQPSDVADGLHPDAQYTPKPVKLVFTGFNY